MLWHLALKLINVVCRIRWWWVDFLKKINKHGATTIRDTRVMLNVHLIELSRTKNGVFSLYDILFPYRYVQQKVFSRHRRSAVLCTLSVA